MFQVGLHCGQIEFQDACVSIAIELTVEHANEPPSFQANSVDVCRPSCIRGEGDPEVFNIVQDSVIAKHRLPWHGISRDYPRNPGILSIPGSTGSPAMGHPGMVPGIPGY